MWRVVLSWGARPRLDAVYAKSFWKYSAHCSAQQQFQHNGRGHRSYGEQASCSSPTQSSVSGSGGTGDLLDAEPVRWASPTQCSVSGSGGTGNILDAEPAAGSSPTQSRASGTVSGTGSSRLLYIILIKDGTGTGGPEPAWDPCRILRGGAQIRARASHTQGSRRSRFGPRKNAYACALQKDSVRACDHQGSCNRVRRHVVGEEASAVWGGAHTPVPSKNSTSGSWQTHTRSPGRREPIRPGQILF